VYQLRVFRVSSLQIAIAQVDKGFQNIGDYNCPVISILFSAAVLFLFAKDDFNCPLNFSPTSFSIRRGTLIFPVSETVE